jgi:hypothetical protein
MRSFMLPSDRHAMLKPVRADRLASLLAAQPHGTDWLPHSDVDRIRGCGVAHTRYL